MANLYLCRRCGLTATIGMKTKRELSGPHQPQAPIRFNPFMGQSTPCRLGVEKRHSSQERHFSDHGSKHARNSVKSRL
jgi:hypothetical protein